MSELRIERKSVLSQTVEVLRQALLDGRFQPGERLVEADLCVRLGVSRPSLREALRRLEAERLVEIIPNRGPIVPVVPWDDALQIYETRKLLEGEAAALAARRAGPEDHARLERALESFEQAAEADDAVGRIAATNEFYDALLNGAGNRVIQEMLGGLNARISFLRSRSMSQGGRGNRSLAEMTRIAEAIRAGDTSEARAAAEDHIDEACQAALKAYRRMNPGRGG